MAGKKRVNRTEHIHFRVTPDEYKTIEAFSLRNKKKVGQYCRESALKKPNKVLLEIHEKLMDISEFYLNWGALDKAHIEALHKEIVEFNDRLKEI